MAHRDRPAVETRTRRPKSIKVSARAKHESTRQSEGHDCVCARRNDMGTALGLIGGTLANSLGDTDATDAFSYSQERAANRGRLRQYLVNHTELLATAAPMDPSDVVATLPATATLRIQDDGAPGLRRPQYGAVHSLLGYWTTDPKLPATVVMPTGTGKTDAVVTALVAQRVPRLLVIVPSDALRDQFTQKLETLGVLPELGLVNDAVARPVVGRLFGRLEDEGDASALARACNVVVSTPRALIFDRRARSIDVRHLDRHPQPAPISTPIVMPRGDEGRQARSRTTVRPLCRCDPRS